MLLRNKSRVIKSLELNLEFDNNITKKQIVNIGDIITLYFRYDRDVIYDIGRISDIRYSTNYGLYKKNESAVIVFDIAEEFNSKQYIIPVSNIIDFKVNSIDIDDDTNIDPEFGIDVTPDNIDPDFGVESGEEVVDPDFGVYPERSN